MRVKRLLKELLSRRDRKRDLRGWRLADVYRVSADGSVMIGRGRDPRGRWRSWIAYLPSLAVDRVAAPD